MTSQASRPARFLRASRDLWRIARSLVPRGRGKRFVATIALSVVAGATEAIGIGLLVLFINVVLDPEKVARDPWPTWAQDMVARGEVPLLLVLFGLATIAVSLFKNSIGAFALWAQGTTTIGNAHSLARRLLARNLARPYDSFVDARVPLLNEMRNNILTESLNVAQSYLFPLMTAISDTVIIASVTTLFFVVDPWVTLAFLLLLGVVYGGYYALSRRRLGRMGRRRAEAAAARLKVINETFGAIKEVKVLGAEEQCVRRFEPPSRALARELTRMRFVSQAPRYVVEALAVAAIVGVFLVELWRGNDRTELVASAALFAIGGFRLLPAMNRLVAAIAQLTFFHAVAARVADELDGPEPHAGREHDSPGAALPSAWRSLRIEDVHFRYPGEVSDALDGVSLRIPFGGMIGLIGPTGCGKSTLIDILCGLLPPSAGTVGVDDTVLGRASVASWQSTLGYVPQHIVLVDDSVARNIAYKFDDSTVDLDRVREAARHAQVDAFIESLPQGYETRLGEAGVRLSGGQRQRLGIARALYRRPRLLILDEATSALDAETEATVGRTIEQLKSSMAVVVVSHRAAPIQACDHVYVMERGRVVKEGNYEVLRHSGVLLAEVDRSPERGGGGEPVRDDEAAPSLEVGGPA